MAKIIHDKVTIDATNTASLRVVDVSGIDIASVATAMAASMGTSVIEIKQSVGGVVSSFTPAQTISSAFPSRIGITVDGISELVLEVTTADTSATDIPVVIYGEETQ